ncbi:sugar ABC transporter substrate-binding protein [Clostridiales bacterium COT073_COT-073]|nr:sugar ABC transporter substrate-binding protein [Clostridiales bacterium COT073_COT-073]
MKKIISLLMAILMVGTALSGCGEKTTPAKEDTKQEASKPAETSKTENTEQKKEDGVMAMFNHTGYPILNEKETFDIYVEQLSPVVAANDKEVVKKGIADTNVDTNFIEVASSSWKEKINILFSTSDLPDAILGDLSVEEKYTQLYPLDEFLTEEIAPNIVKFFNSRPEYWEMLKAPDGHIYSLPTGDETYWNAIDSQMFINENWLKAVGKEVPKNAAELREVLEAFKNGDPNGNGDTADEVPMTFRGVWGWGDGMENALAAFGVFESSSHVMTKDGTVKFAAQQDEYFEALQFFAELYKDGLLDTEVFTHSQDQYKAKLAEEVDKYGVVITYDKQDKTRTWLPLLLADKNGNITVGLNNIEHVDGFSITKACKNPGALVRWYDYCNKDLETIMAWNRGVKDEAWRVPEGKEGMVEFLNDPEIQKAKGANNREELRRMQSFAGKSPAYFNLSYQDKIFSNQPKKLKPLLNQEVIDKGYGVKALPLGFASKENSEQRVLMLADIDNYLNKFVATSIVNGIDQKGWEDHLKTLEKLKVNEYVKLCQEFVDNQKK